MSSDDERLLEFLRDRDAACPRCGYNLRGLSEPRCPECAERLELRVGLSTPRFGWLVAAMTPGLFSGVCAALLAFPLWRSAGVSGPPTPMYVAEAFGVVSAAGAVLMYASRRRLLAMPGARRVGLAVAVWVVHVAAFGLLVWSLR